ncbi:FG-GAP repeat protein [Sorangium sp. So ce1000]|uniref:FG-GAP repeat protein n=1 Tax=Sorangium sp. So ce1000 TaxID=3133325 RepID=UPI003F5D880A
MSALNPAHGLLSEFTSAGVVVTRESSEAAGRITMKLARYGCEGELVPLDVVAEPRGANNRVELEYRAPSAGVNVTEWYLNGPLGLEQGFSLDSPPPCRSEGEGRVELEIALGGDLSPQLSEDGQSMELFDASGAAVLRYADLVVQDARGNVLPAEIRLSEAHASIVVDDTGAIYPLEIDPLIATEQQVLYASNASSDDYFGWSVAVSGSTAVVGAMGAEAAYVFVRDGASWSQAAVLKPSDGLPGDFFGVSVAIDGDTIVVGNSASARSIGRRAAYVFERSGGVWRERQKLVAQDSPGGDSRFGYAVAASGNTIMVGAPNDYGPGGAYIFVRSGAAWVQQAELAPSHDTRDQGYAVALDGDTAVMGSDCDDGSSAHSCQVYVFTRAGDAWSEQAVLYPPVGPTPHYRFGGSLSLSSETVAVGTIVYNEYGPDRLATVVFARGEGAWTRQAMLYSDDVDAPGWNGWFRNASVAVSGDRLILGGSDDGGRGPRIFARIGGVWTPQSMAESSTWSRWDVRVALSGDTLIAGTWTDSARGTSAGAAHVIQLKEAPPDYLVEARAFVEHAADIPFVLDDPDTNKFGTPSSIDWTNFTGTTQGASLFTLSLLHADSTLTPSILRGFWGSTSPTSTGLYGQVVAGNHFKRISKIGDILPGDLLVINYTDNGSGHTAIVDASPTAIAPAIEPVVPGTTQYSLRVIDSTSTAHGCSMDPPTADTRWVPTDPTKPCRSGSTDGGAGRGTMRLYAVSPGLPNAGNLAGYSWSLTSGSAYYPQTGARPHVIGRFAR